MDGLFYMIGAMLAAWLCHYMAEKRDRNAVGYAIGGFMFGLLTAVLLLILGKKEPELTLEQAETLLNSESLK